MTSPLGTPPSSIPLTELEGASPFAARHIGPSADEQAKMLAVLGHGSLEELAGAAVPAVIRATQGLTLPPAATEAEVLTELRELAAQTRVTTPMLGLGYAGTHTRPGSPARCAGSPAGCACRHSQARASGW